MNHKIRKLLDKKKLTGEEFGKAYIINRTQEAINGELILTDEELKILWDKIIDSLEINKLKAYTHFYSWLERAHLVAKGHYNNFYVGLSILYHKLDSTVQSEQGLNNLKKIIEDLSQESNNYHQFYTFTKNILLSMSVFTFVKDKDGLDYVLEARKSIIRGLPSILSYNKVVDLFADFFKIPEISQVFKIETERMFQGIGMLNDKIVLLRDILYGTKEEITQKLKVVDDIYSIVNIKDFEPTEDAIKKALKSIKNSIFSYNPYEVMKILYPQK